MSSTPCAPFTSRRPMSVSTSPGATMLTWIPWLRSSFAERDARAPRARPSPCCTEPSTAPCRASPRSRSSRCRRAARRACRAARASRAPTRRTRACARGGRAPTDRCRRPSSPRLATPALFTSRSIGPSCSRTAATMRSSCVVVVDRRGERAGAPAGGGDLVDRGAAPRLRRVGSSPRPRRRRPRGRARSRGRCRGRRRSRARPVLRVSSRSLRRSRSRRSAVDPPSETGRAEARAPLVEPGRRAGPAPVVDRADVGVDAQRREHAEVQRRDRAVWLQRVGEARPRRAPSTSHSRGVVGDRLDVAVVAEHRGRRLRAPAREARESRRRCRRRARGSRGSTPGRRRTSRARPPASSSRRLRRSSCTTLPPTHWPRSLSGVQITTCSTRGSAAATCAAAASASSAS